MVLKRVAAGLFLLMFSLVAARAQEAFPSAQAGYLTVAASLQHKIASGRLLFHAGRLLETSNERTMWSDSPRMKLVVYMPAFPTAAQLDELARAGVACFTNTWTPPMPNHPNGFFLAEAPVARINTILALDCVRLLGSAEGLSRPKNNVAAAAIRANAAWSRGWMGKGVKVGVLDSGIDTAFAATELPSCFDRMDYSNYPHLDDDVRNRITGHGTHVAASAVGRGYYSSANTGNEGMAYSGMAPQSCLAFLKIGDDSSAGASDAAIIAAFHDVVTRYHARVVNMSYGGWSAYHDGSEAMEQKVDWCYTQGAAVFLSAGNSAASNRHISGIAPANGATDARGRSTSGRPSVTRSAMAGYLPNRSSATRARPSPRSS